MSRRSVVVGVCHSPESWPAMSWAVVEAGRNGGRLVVCYACTAGSPLAGPGAGARMALLEVVEPALARAVAAARVQLGGAQRLTVVPRGEPPGEALVGLAHGADLLVVGAPSRQGWMERGSTLHDVVRHASCPVVVVRPSTFDAHIGGAADERGARPFRGHVVVGVDGSVPARAALEFGFEYASDHRRPLLAVHVTPRAASDLWYDDELLETRLSVEPAALELLAIEVEPWQHKYPEVTVKRAVYMGRSVDGILRASDGATLLAVGNSRRGRVSRLLGSVTQGAIDRAQCPVAVVGPGREAAELVDDGRG
jgi:nucleotide-binding universal stress UspA family protein